MEIDTRVEIYPLKSMDRPKHSHSPSKSKLAKALTSAKALPKAKPLIKPKSPVKQPELIQKQARVASPPVSAVKEAPRSDSREKRPPAKATKKQAMLDALKRVATVKVLEEAFKSKRVKQDLLYLR